jgi:hypothetical protein
MYTYGWVINVHIRHTRVHIFADIWPSIDVPIDIGLFYTIVIFALTIHAINMYIYIIYIYIYIRHAWLKIYIIPLVATLLLRTPLQAPIRHKRVQYLLRWRNPHQRRNMFLLWNRWIGMVTSYFLIWAVTKTKLSEQHREVYLKFTRRVHSSAKKICLWG